MLNANEPVWSSRPRHRSQAPPSLPWLGLTCGHAFKESRGWGVWGICNPGPVLLLLHGVAGCVHVATCYLIERPRAFNQL